MTWNLIDYVVARDPELPPMQAGLYEFVLAGNGLFVRSARAGLRCIIPVVDCAVRGLAPIEPRIEFLLPRVPHGLGWQMLEWARQERDADGQMLEVMFHLTWIVDEGRWKLVKPAQRQSRVAVHPIGPFAGTSYETHLIEVHSHHEMHCHDFSSADDDSEKGMFRLYGLLVDIFVRPRLRLRVSVFDHAQEIPACVVFDLPPELEAA